MTTIYRCGSDKRREGILAPPSGAVLNGIDYLQVIDEVPVAGMPRQRTILLHLFRDAPPHLEVGNVRITGGQRVTRLAAAWIARADAVVAPGVSAAEAAWYATIPDATHVLVIRVDALGDFSIYNLALVAGAGSEAPPAGFDPVLSRVDFGFKVECKSDFDCAATSACPPVTGDAPAIDYLAKDYSSFRRVLLDRLSVTVPDWRERSPADPLMTMIEVLAYAGDHLSYQQDAIGTEAYLSTARRRISVRRHARLLDYQMHEGACARAWITLDVDTDFTVTPGQLQFLVARDEQQPIMGTEDLARLTTAPMVFEPLHPQRLHVGNHDIHFYTWADQDCCLPRGATRATLLADDHSGRATPPVLAVGDVLIFEEVLGQPTWLAADADPTHRHVVRLTSVTPANDPFTGADVLEIEWHLTDALPFPLCLSARDGSGREIADVSMVRGNVVLAEHGATISGEKLPDPAGVRKFRPRLAKLQLSHAVPYDHQQAVTRAAAQTGGVDPRAARPAIHLDGPDGPWKVQRDLLESSPTANDFVVEVDDEARAWLRFGDGVLGREPIAGLTATYRIGRGTTGNVGRDTIGRVVLFDTTTSAATPIKQVRNPLAAAGGADPEPATEVKLYAPSAFRKNQRAVGEADYAAWAETYPDVQRAVAVRRWTGSWYTMYVVVDRKGGRLIDDQFRAGLTRYLDRFRLAGFDLELRDPTFVSLDLNLVICVEPGYFRADVRVGLYDAFRAFFDPDRFTFGQPVWLSRVVAAAMAVPGVEWVDMRDPRARFQRFGMAAAGELAAQVITMGPTEIARLENSPSLPEHGLISFDLDGGR